MKKNKKIFILGISFLLLILLLLSSNTLILNIIVNKDYRISKTDINKFKSSNEVFYNFDQNSYLGGLYELFSIEGWAFCETTEPNNSKTINLIFKHTQNDKSYYIPGVVHIRSDVYNAFIETNTINGVMHGFTCLFASYNIPIGEYDIYIYVKENEQDYGLVNTGYIFNKEVGTARIEINYEN